MTLSSWCYENAPYSCCGQPSLTALEETTNLHCTCCFLHFAYVHTAFFYRNGRTTVRFKFSQSSDKQSVEQQGAPVINARPSLTVREQGPGDLSVRSIVLRGVNQLLHPASGARQAVWPFGVVRCAPSTASSVARCNNVVVGLVLQEGGGGQVISGPKTSVSSADCSSSVVCFRCNPALRTFIILSLVPSFLVETRCALRIRYIHAHP